MGAVHTIVHLVAWINIQLETGAHFAVSWFVDLIIQDFSNVFILVIVSKLFVQFGVALWLHRVTARYAGILVSSTLKLFASKIELKV